MNGASNDLPLVRRVRGEFVEMPGLRLTAAQARRLWGLDEQTCQALLDLLIESGFLNQATNGTYGRVTDERASGGTPMAPGVSPASRASNATPPGETALHPDARLAASCSLGVLVVSPDAEARDQCARLIHGHSRFASGPFVSCAPGSAFRLAFARAAGGTLFIDDVSALDASEQGELSALMVERGPLKADRGPRIVAGTSRPLDIAVSRGAFDGTLYYRLNTILMDRGCRALARVGRPHPLQHRPPRQASRTHVR